MKVFCLLNGLGSTFGVEFYQKIGYMGLYRAFG